MDNSPKHHPETIITVEKLSDGEFKFEVVANGTLLPSRSVVNVQVLKKALEELGVGEVRAEKFIAELLATKESSKTITVNGPAYK
jgi:hypothetical protein